MGMFRMYFEWDWDGARKALEHAIELNPSLVAAQYHYAWLLEMFGETEKASTGWKPLTNTGFRSCPGYWPGMRRAKPTGMIHVCSC